MSSPQELNLHLTIGDTVSIDGREHSFTRLLRDGRLAFEDVENGKPRLPLYEADLLRLYNAERVVFHNWAHLPKRHEDVAHKSLDALPAHMASDAEWRRSYCVAFDAASQTPKSERGLVPLIDAVAKANDHLKKPHWKTLRTWLADRGAPNRRPLRAMRSFTEKRGRNKGVDQAVEEIIEEAISTVFQNRAALPPTAVFEYVAGTIASRNNDLIASFSENERIPSGLLIPPASQSTVFRRLKETDYYKTTRNRFGWRYADRELTPLKKAPQATFPLERVEIDHTKIDGWMFFDPNSALPCGGRPWLTMAIDAYSRYPLGFYIGFEPPSVYSVMMCLQQAIGPKQDFLERFAGFRYDWLALGVPMKLVADNAKEVVGLSLPKACAELAIELETSPVKTPKHKGIVERFFRTMNDRFIHRLPGTTYGDAKKLKSLEIDPKNTMRMSFDEFQRLFAEWLLGDYSKSRNRMIGSTPERRWTEGTAKKRVHLPDKMSLLKVVLARHASATLTRNGIRFNNLNYRNADVVRRVLASARATKHGVDFRFDPRDLGTIYVLHSDGAYLRMDCDEDYAKGLSLWQHKLIQKENRSRDRSPKSFNDLMITRKELIDETLAAIKAGVASSDDARFVRLGESGSILVTSRRSGSKSRSSQVLTPGSGSSSIYKDDLNREPAIDRVSAEPTIENEGDLQQPAAAPIQNVTIPPTQNEDTISTSGPEASEEADEFERLMSNVSFVATQASNGHA